MSYTVIGSMDEFLRNIQPTDAQTREAATSHLALRLFLKDNLQVTSDFLTGSYSRNTMIRHSRDIDCFLILDSSYYFGWAGWTGYAHQANGPANLLDHIKRLLEKKYTKTDIGRDGQAVRVEFSHVHIDVVPAFALSNGDYCIPDTRTNSWSVSNPTKHNQAITAMNASDNIKGKFVPLAKMIKYWNYSHNYGRKGFFLEMLGRDIYQYWSADSYANAIFTYFDAGLTYVDNSYMVIDPGAGTDLMKSYIDSQARKDSAITNFTTARSLADAAIRANMNGDNHLAIEKWQRLFGSAFPSYG